MKIHPIAKYALSLALISILLSLGCYRRDRNLERQLRKYKNMYEQEKKDKLRYRRQVLGHRLHPISQPGRWVDLTHSFDKDTIYWPTVTEPFRLEVVSYGMTKKGYFYAAYKYSAPEHGGTHMDAPIHFAKGKRTTEAVPLLQLSGPAVVIDVSEKALKNRDYRVSVEDFKQWEKKHGKIIPGAMVLLRTGYGKFWPDRKKYMGTDKLGPDAVPLLHFPGLHPDAAQWLVDNRKIHAIGLDTPSIDYGRSKLFKSHQILFKHNIPAFENVAHLDKLPAKGAWVIALPMKIKRGSGGPLRIVAYIPDHKK